MTAKTKRVRLRALPYVPPEERPKVVVASDPPGICRDCQKKNTVGNEKILVTYCSHAMVGSIRQLQDGQPVGIWWSCGPVTVQQWAAIAVDTAIIQKVASAGGEDPPGSHTAH